VPKDLCTSRSETIGWSADHGWRPLYDLGSNVIFPLKGSRPDRDRIDVGEE
jgi:hypothetical protein